MRSKAVVSVTLSALLSACATAKPSLPLGGRMVELRPAEGRKGSAVEGELLAVGPERLFIQAPEGVRAVPCADIEQARVRLHGLDGRKAWGWTVLGALATGAALAVACGNAGNNDCGNAFAITAGVWALFGAPSAASLAKSSQLRVRGPDFEALRPYARYPQGLPEGLDLETPR